MLKLKLVSPEKLVMQGEFASVLLPGHNGYLDIGANHTVFMTEVQPGCITLKCSAKTLKKYFVSGGYAHIKENTVVILGDVVEPQGDINLKRAKAAAKRASERLANTTDSTVDIKRALQSQSRARLRIDIAEGRL